MDPISLLLMARTAYEAVKSGIAAGKELQGVATDLGSLFESVAALTRHAASPPRGNLLSGKTAEQMAMEAYAAKAEADQLMADLKNHFVGEYGLAAWDQVVAATTQIRKDQKAAALQEAKEQEEFMNNVVVWGTVFMLFIVVVACGLLAAIALTH
jgi:CHASE3 domain sensor protein